MASLSRHWLAGALLASAAMLAVAHGFETFGGLPPCHMCLQQREAYWAAIAVAALGIGAMRLAPSLRPAVWAGGALTLVFLAGGFIAVRQAGAEWHWWAGPASCSGAGTVTAADIARLMRGSAGAAPRCDVAAWRLFGVSMAGWNALASVALGAFSAWAAAQAFRREEA